MKGGTLVSKIDFAHAAHVDAPDQVVVAELPFSMNVPVNRQITLFFLLFSSEVMTSSSFPPWRREDLSADPGRAQDYTGPTRDWVSQPLTADRSDLVAGARRHAINRCQCV